MTSKKNTRVILSNNFIYSGNIISEDDTTLVLFDIKSGRTVTISKKNIMSREEW